MGHQCGVWHCFILMTRLSKKMFCSSEEDMDKSYLGIVEVQIAGGEFVMGDHNGFVDPGHPSDELPLHTVKINSMFVSVTHTTNQQFLAFLNSSLLKGSIEGTEQHRLWRWRHQYLLLHSSVCAVLQHWLRREGFFSRLISGLHTRWSASCGAARLPIATG